MVMLENSKLLIVCVGGLRVTGKSLLRRLGLKKVMLVAGRAAASQLPREAPGSFRLTLEIRFGRTWQHEGAACEIDGRTFFFLDFLHNSLRVCYPFEC